MQYQKIKDDLEKAYRDYRELGVLDWLFASEYERALRAKLKHAIWKTTQHIIHNNSLNADERLQITGLLSWIHDYAARWAGQ